MQRAAGKQLLCILRRSVNGSFGPHHHADVELRRHPPTKLCAWIMGSVMRPMRPVRGEPTMIMSGQQARLSGRKRGCRPLERSVVGDL